MKTKKFSSMVFAVCLVCLSMVLLASCGTTYVKPWGKTFEFSGISNASNTKYTLERNEIAFDDLLVKYFDQIDWDSTLELTSSSVKNGSNALSLINTKANNALKTTNITSLKFVFDTEKNQKVAVNSTTYSVTQKGETKPAEYIISTGANSDSEKIYFKHYNGDTFHYSSSLDSTSSSKLPTSSYTLEIKFKKAIETTKGNTTSSIKVTYYALYKAK